MTTPPRLFDEIDTVEAELDQAPLDLIAMLKEALHR